MKAEQKRLAFRSGAEIAESRYIETVVSETGQDKWTVMSVTPQGDYAAKFSPRIFGDDYFPFQVGQEYAKQTFIDFATANKFSIFETSSESATYVPIRIDIGVVTEPLVDGPSIGSDTAGISWTNTNEDKNEGINVYIKVTGTQVWTLAAVKAKNDAAHVFTGLTPSTNYTFKVAQFTDFVISAGVTGTFATGAP